ncbi:MAG: acyltransferase [Rubellimicrobium sp.]|nr:acyltransferase [Rubellimicrobium sp.]
MRYRREIDGLRAVAVLPVILYHAGVTLFGGGYVGVDVFFVISGYLITTILIGDLERGHLSIAHFYERRARRILPALFPVMLACIPFAYMWMLPQELKNFAKSLVAVTLFGSNMLFWREDGYFAPAAEMKPLLHTWSLAVEEQYYLLFPLFLLLVWKLGRRRVFWIVCAIAAASLLLSEWGWRHKPVANFYFAPTRAWELLAGSICAFVSFGRAQRSSNLLSAAGLLLILAAVFVYDDATPFPSLYALAPVIGSVLIILFAADETWVARLLSLRPFVGIGLISYSAYLWHQPLFAFARLRSLTTPAPWLMAALALLSLALAWASWRYIEQPFRNRRHPFPATRARVFVASGVVGALFIAVGLAGYVGKGLPWRSNGVVTMGEIGQRLTQTYGIYQDCDGLFDAVGHCQTSSTPEVLLWGDSFAMQLAQGILASEPDVAMQQYTNASCSPILGIAQVSGKTADWSRDCIRFNDDVIDWLSTHKSVDVVVLSSPFRSILEKDIISSDNSYPDTINRIHYVVHPEQHIAH